MIDRYDFVIRFNDCWSFSSGGKRTDVVAVCNTGRPAKKMLEPQEWRSHPAVVGASEIWSVREPKKLAQMSTRVQVLRSDYTTRFKAFCTETEKRHSVIDRAIHCHTQSRRQYACCVSARALCRTQQWHDCYLLVTCSIDSPRLMLPSRGGGHEGWEGHPFAAKRKLVDSYVAIGRLMRLPSAVWHHLPAFNSALADQSCTEE